MALLASDVITSIRRKLDQRPLENEDVQTDSSVLGSPSTNFSDPNLLERIDQAQRYISQIVKAQHVPALITEYTGPFPSVSDNVEILRPLFSRVSRTGIRATQRSVDRERRLTVAGRAASATYPTYNYEDGQLTINPTGGTESAWIVVLPTTLASVGTNLQLDERFEAAIIFYVVSSCYETMRQIQLSDAYFQLYQDEIQPYVREVRLDPVVDDREVDVE